MTWWRLVERQRRLVYLLRRLSEFRARPHILFPLAYCLCLGAYYLAYGKLFQSLPSVFFLAAIPVVALLSPSRGPLKYWTPFIMILLSYEALAGVVGTVAISGGVTSLYSLDKLVWGLNLTGWVQSAFSSPGVTTLTLFFYELHMPLVAFTSAIVWLLHRDYFGRYVTAMTLTSYSALATFIILPASPPWFVGAATNLIQTAGSVTGANIAALNSLIVSDQFAAFPSLHGAYAVIFCYFLLKVDRRMGLLAVPLAACILFSTLYLGQHYLIDLIGGTIYALIPCLASERFQLFSMD
jgi:membrane-associated phospholipid phosphatase